MQETTNAKSQVVERIKSATNILVTVNTNPDVDELSAALAFALMLNKIDKHATAVVSGALPPAINFLEPDKTFENTIDSLRDFIIALDKEKADRLRYKVEDDVVRIFITPYRTTITQDDLEFSQGDFNVDLIVALGVEKQDDIDKAIAAHGRILHDATVATINVGNETSSLGTIDWHDPNASSLCEMLMSLSEALQPNLVDQQIATALLTGIVAATDRFSNEHTSPRVMTMSAQLMAAGANQQLIATKLAEAHEIDGPSNPDGTKNLKEGESSNLDEAKPATEEATKTNDGELQVTHQETPAAETAEPTTENTTPDPEAELAQQLEAAQLPTAPTSAVSDLQQAVDNGGDQANTSATPPITPDNKPSWMEKRIEPPTMGGTLNATTEQAEEDSQAAAEDQRNHVLLDHDSDSSLQDEQPQTAQAINSFGLDYEEQTVPPIQEVTQPEVTVPAPEQPSSTPSGEPTLAQLEAEAHAKAAAELANPADNTASDLHQAREAVTSALNPEVPEVAPPVAPAVEPIASPTAGMPPVPPMPDFSTLPPLPPTDITVTEDGTLIPPMQTPEPQAPVVQQSPLDVVQPPAQPLANDPGQFRIPGQ